jgi:hypothetical protein
VQAAPNRRYTAKTLARLIGVEIEKVADRVEGIACPGPVMKNPDQGVPLRPSTLLADFSADRVLPLASSIA